MQGILRSLWEEMRILHLEDHRPSMQATTLFLHLKKYMVADVFVFTEVRVGIMLVGKHFATYIPCQLQIPTISSKMTIL